MEINNDKSSIKKKHNVNNSDERRKKDNHKKILCHNMILYNKCDYGNKCLYAHSLEDQNVDTIREYAYKIIKSDNDLSMINLNKDKELYRTLLSLSKPCQDCINHKCTGGYNCKYGTCDTIYTVCENDLIVGICKDTECNNIHLTERNLRPFFMKQREPIKYTSVELNDEYFINNEVNELSENTESDNSDELFEMIGEEQLLTVSIFGINL